MKYNLTTGRCMKAPNPYQTEYTGFTWKNIHSSRFNCFIENKGTLTFEPAPSFSNNFVSPEFQSRTYYTGTQNSNKSITFNLVFYNLTLHELNAAMRWLNRFDISDLFLDYAPYWKYTCKLASIGSMDKRPAGKARIGDKFYDTYLCQVEVKFETVFESNAIAAYSQVYLAPLTGTETNYQSIVFADMNQLTVNYGEMQEDIGTTFAWNKNDLSLATPDELIDPLGAFETSAFADQETVEDNSNTNFVYDGGTKQYRLDLALPNRFSSDANFKVYLYNIHGGFTIYAVEKELDMTSAGATWREINSRMIAHVRLNLDSDKLLNLQYNSDDGSILCCGQLVEQLQDENQNLLCAYKMGLANIVIPAAYNDTQYSLLELRIFVDNPSSMVPESLVAYDYKELML